MEFDNYIISFLNKKIEVEIKIIILTINVILSKFYKI